MTHGLGDWPIEELEEMCRLHLEDLSRTYMRGPGSAKFKPDSRRVLPGERVDRSGTGSQGGMCADLGTVGLHEK